MSDDPYIPQGWIAVDLDGTLAKYDGWKGITHIGDPVPIMRARVRQWLSEGKKVKVFTARVGSHLSVADDLTVRKAIQDWCLKHLGQSLEITATKDMHMIALWDDRATQVIPNTGVALQDQIMEQRNPRYNPPIV